MKITLGRTGDSALFEASNEAGHAVIIEEDASLGGNNKAPSPSEYLGCLHGYGYRSTIKEDASASPSS
jgi:uncharacterized OsmC-like protein